MSPTFFFLIQNLPITLAIYNWTSQGKMIDDLTVKLFLVSNLNSHLSHVLFSENVIENAI